MRDPTRNPRLRVLSFTLLSGLLVASPLTACQQVGRRPVLPPAEIVQGLGSKDGSKRSGAIVAVQSLLESNPSSVQLEELREGLIRLATKESDADVRASAVTGLLAWAKSEPVRGTGEAAAVLERVYRDTPGGGQKGVILVSLHELGVEGQGAIQFLQSVAVDPNPPWFGFPILAIDELAKMGEPGRDVLRTLHEEELVSTPEAARRLEDLAKRGFRIGGGSL